MYFVEEVPATEEEHAVDLLGFLEKLAWPTGAGAEKHGDPRSDNGPMINVERERFAAMVGKALDGLPPKLGEVMRNVAVTVDHDGGPPGLLGLYRGVPLTERTTQYSEVLPDQITIYRQAICTVCRSDAEVVEQVRRTVIHEVGHHFGLDDTRLRELGW